MQPNNQKNQKWSTAPDDLDLTCYINIISSELADYFRRPSITMYDPVNNPSSYPGDGRSGYSCSVPMAGERR